jgi:hypothetical protein
MTKLIPVTFVYEDSDTKQPITITLNTIREWKFNLFQLRSNIINEIEASNTQLPQYHITISYHQKIRNRSVITTNHRYIRNSFEELFNPRYRGNPTKSSHLFFIERYKSKLLSSDGNTYYLFNQVKTDNIVEDTITNNKEYDFYDSEVVRGSFHSHILKSEISNEVLMKPNKKLRQLILEVTGSEYLPDNIDGLLLKQIKMSLIEALVKRSRLVGNSNAAVKIVPVSSQYGFDGFLGWKGMIAYATKTCYNADMMVEVIDSDNSSITLRSSTIPIQVANKRVVLPEDTFQNQ